MCNYDLLEELIWEEEPCNNIAQISFKMSKEKVIKGFSRMIMQGKIRLALPFITDESEKEGKRERRGNNEKNERRVEYSFDLTYRNLTKRPIVLEGKVY